MKLISNVDGPIDLKIADTENKRAHFLSHIKGVGKVEQERHSFSRLKKLARMNYPYTQLAPEMYMELNTWLEAGNRIEDYMPWLDTTYEMDWQIKPSDKKHAWDILKPDHNNIIIHTSSMKFNTKKDLIGKWNLGTWKQIVRKLHEEIPDLNLIWLGAQYDMEMLEFLREDFPIAAAIELKAPVVISMLKGCTGFISYQCGLSVISICEQIPTFMVYYDNLREMAHSFCPRESIDNEQLYKPTYFDELNNNPDLAVEWTKGLLV